MSLPAPPATAAVSCGPLRVDGPWFRDEAGRKVLLRGVTYGPFKPNGRGEPWPEEAQLRADLAKIRALGFDSVRIYEIPTDPVLQACADHGLRLLCGIPWTQHVDFFTEKLVAEDARRTIVKESRRLASHACVTAIIVGNEIEKTLVRWMGPSRVLFFIESLIADARKAAPGKLVSYAGYPSTEYLIPRNSDFIAFNVFLERPEVFAHYVQHLQNLAAGKPVVITEFGLDSKSHGEAAQAEAFRWQQHVCTRQGVAGNFWFSYTDEWHRGGDEVTGWEFGLVRRDRSEKSVIADCALRIADSPVTAGSDAPFANPQSAIRNAQSGASVLVCTHNGAATLRACLEALSRQTHPDYEVLVIDDGSTDDTATIAESFPFVRYKRQDHAGLSAARNLGMALAKHELLAYTDDDCIPDEDWLLNVVPVFDDARCVAAGGPNLPPPPRNGTEACVAVAPGAPSHVLLDDFEAEHLPGCNLVIRRSALRAIGGFREEFVCAGDDVDVCWRLQAHGGSLRFVPGAVVWHHRRRSVRAYLRQQRGYGHAEAMLMRRYPHRFAWLGGARWRGMIYGDTPPHLLHTGAVIRFGRFGNALFQSVYATSAPSLWDWMTGLTWLVMSLLLLSLNLVWPHAWLIGGATLFLMFAAAFRRTRVLPETAGGVPARLVPLLWLLCLLQPIVRDWGRLAGMVRLKAWPKGRVMWPWKHVEQPMVSRQTHWWSSAMFWSEEGVGREQLLHALRAQAPKCGLVWGDTTEESACDGVLMHRSTGALVCVATVTEFHGGERQLTRVAIGQQHRWWLQPLGVASFLAALLCYALHAPQWMVFALCLGFVAVAWRSFLAMSAARALVHSAAARCGLCPDETSRDARANELPERVLASAGRSAEL
jgi:GT2 family glycosyltransferase/exo-beta-1,3-glucanase (GH17 family)